MKFSSSITDYSEDPIERQRKALAKLGQMLVEANLVSVYNDNELDKTTVAIDTPIKTIEVFSSTKVPRYLLEDDASREKAREHATKNLAIEIGMYMLKERLITFLAEDYDAEYDVILMRAEASINKPEEEII